MDAQRVHRGSLVDMLESIRAKLMSSSTNVSPGQVLHIVNILDFAAERLHQIPPDSAARFQDLRQQTVAGCMTNLAHKFRDIVAPDIKVQSRDELCPIYLEVLQLECQASMIRLCRHKFHAPCMIEWLQHKQSCLLCRTQLQSSAQW